MKFISLLAVLLIGCNVANADVPGSDIIGGPNSPGGTVKVFKYFPNVFVRVYPGPVLGCQLVVTTAMDSTPAGQVTHTTSQVVCPK